MTQDTTSTGLPELPESIDLCVDKDAHVYAVYTADQMYAFRAEGIRAAQAAAVPAEPVAWRCFHCDERFTEAADAELHFGRSELDRPACQFDVAHLRWMEAQHRRNVDDDSEALRTVSGLVGEHERLRKRAEESGYAKGLADAKKYPQELGLMPGPTNEGTSQEAQAAVGLSTLKIVVREAWMSGLAWMEANHDEATPDKWRAAAEYFVTAWVPSSDNPLNYPHECQHPTCGCEGPCAAEEANERIDLLPAASPPPATQEAREALASVLRVALSELVRLKDMKDRLQQLHEMGHGTDYTDYHRLQPLAWEAARAALAQPPQAASAQGEALDAEWESKDAQRLEWLLHRISGKELRRLGVSTLSGGLHWGRVAIDAALAASGAEKP